MVEELSRSEIIDLQSKIDNCLQIADCVVGVLHNPKYNEDEMAGALLGDLKILPDKVKQLCDYCLDYNTIDVLPYLQEKRSDIREYIGNGFIKKHTDLFLIFCICENNIRGVFKHHQAPTQAATELKRKDLHYYCRKAIEKGYLIKTDAGYKKTKEITKAQLAYFLGNFLNNDGTFPDKEYSILFGESRLGKARDQLVTNKNGNGKPREYEKIDEVLSK